MAVSGGSTALADTYIWRGGSTKGGDMHTPSKWDKGACPGPGDTARFEKGDEIVVANDDDVTLLASLKCVSLNCWTEAYRAVLVFDVSTNTVMSATLRGSGRFIKRGAGSLEFLSTDQEGAANAYSSYGVYNVGGDGIIVEAGTLILAQHNGFEYYYGCMTVNEGATVIVSSNKTTVVGALNGAGTVAQLGTAEKTFQIGKTEFADKPNHWKGSFSGKLTGKMALLVRGNQEILNPNNDFSGSVQVHYGRTTSDYGWARFWSFGHPKGTPSAAGSSTGAILSLYGAHIGYLGDGEVTDRSFTFDAQGSGTGSTPQEVYFDAGPYGNLTLNGSFGLGAYGQVYKMRSFVLTGTNANPVTVAGPFKMNMSKSAADYDYNFYIRKEGSGAWNFRKNASSTFKGVFDVREGTLGFDSIAETNVVCALGLATRLSDEFSGVWDDSHLSRYALRAGAQAAETSAVLEFNGSESCKSATRPLLLTGDAHFRANGTDGAAIDFADVSAAAAGAEEKTLVLDGESAADNVMRDIDDGEAVVSVVKDGTGTWVLDGDQTFSGDLIVKGGTLKVQGPKPMRYFRVTFANDNEPKATAYGGYIGEFGLYAADGSRQNKGVTFQNTGNWKIGDAVFTFPAVPTTPLEAGRMTYTTVPGQSSNAATIKESGDGCLDYLCDGAYNYAEFSYRLYSMPATVTMRLADDAKEITHLDFCQRNDDSGKQNATCIRLDGSCDGLTWRTLAETNSLPYFHAGDRWYFSSSAAKVSENPDARTLGDGEGMALAARAVDGIKDQLAHVRSYSVAAGTVLEVESENIPVISKLVIDGDTGCGKISGFRFADNIAIDVRTKGRPKSGTLPADLSGILNFDDVTPVVTVNGEADGKYQARIRKNGIDIVGPGLMMIVR